MHTGGECTHLISSHLSPPQAKLPELMDAIERMEDLVIRYCGRRDAPVNAHTLAEDIRRSKLEALLLDDLEKHVQLNRAKLTSYAVLREEHNTYCECTGHTHARKSKPKGPPHPGEDDPMTSVHSLKARAIKDIKDSKTRTGTGTRTRNHLNVGIVERAATTRRILGVRRTRPRKVVLRERTKTRTQRTLTILTRRIQQTVNQNLKSVDSTRFFQCGCWLKCESLNGSRLESIQVQERRHGPRALHTREADSW